MTDPRTHWDRIYAERQPWEVSWYQRDPRISLAMIRRCGLAPDAPIIDVGGGASTLADRLLDAGVVRPAVLDVSGLALQRARERLGPRAEEIDWYQADVCHWSPPYRFALWHDRAVFHFLTGPAERRRYVRTLRTSLGPGGHLVMAAFGPGGPPRCSGLPVMHYDAEALLGELGAGFRLEEEAREDHMTPGGRTQSFRFFRLRRLPPGGDG
jgi:SAM-dependent methyltransferase